jgi:DNA-binding CsgD family transcriptional regulator
MAYSLGAMLDFLPVDDVRSIVHLLGQVAVEPLDLPGKRRFLMQGLSQLIGADIWFWLHIKDTGAGRPPAAFMFIDGGWSNEAQRTSVVIGTNSPAAESLEIAMRKDAASHRTRRLKAYMGTNTWEASPLVRDYLRPVNIGDWLNSIYPMGDFCYGSINFMRRGGQPDFSPRDVCIAHIILGDIDWLHREGTDIPARENVEKLSHRQKQVLLHLMSGDGTKQIARKLSMSPFTVNDHLKLIYHRFGVSGRGELLAQFLSGGPSAPVKPLTGPA